MGSVERRPIESPDAGDFSSVADAGDAAWATALDDLDRRQPDGPATGRCSRRGSGEGSSKPRRFPAGAMRR